MHKSTFFWASLSLLTFSSSLALADDICDTKARKEACITADGQDGICLHNGSKEKPRTPNTSNSASGIYLYCAENPCANKPEGTSCTSPLGASARCIKLSDPDIMYCSENESFPCKDGSLGDSCEEYGKQGTCQERDSPPPGNLATNNDTPDKVTYCDTVEPCENKNSGDTCQFRNLEGTCVVDSDNPSGKSCDVHSSCAGKIRGDTCLDSQARMGICVGRTYDLDVSDEEANLNNSTEYEHYCSIPEDHDACQATTDGAYCLTSLGVHGTCVTIDNQGTTRHGCLEVSEATYEPVEYEEPSDGDNSSSYNNVTPAANNAPGPGDMTGGGEPSPSPEADRGCSATSPASPSAPTGGLVAIALGAVVGLRRRRR